MGAFLCNKVAIPSQIRSFVSYVVEDDIEYHLSAVAIPSQIRSFVSLHNKNNK